MERLEANWMAYIASAGMVTRITTQHCRTDTPNADQL